MAGMTDGNNYMSVHIYWMHLIYSQMHWWSSILFSLGQVDWKCAQLVHATPCNYWHAVDGLDTCNNIIVWCYSCSVSDIGHTVNIFTIFRKEFISYVVFLTQSGEIGILLQFIVHVLLYYNLMVIMIGGSAIFYGSGIRWVKKS